jgi:hypothetical protein
VGSQQIFRIPDGNGSDEDVGFPLELTNNLTLTEVLEDATSSSELSLAMISTSYGELASTPRHPHQYPCLNNTYPCL